MNIQGLDYNTQREKLVLPEYGREIQKMVNYCMTLPDRDARLRCAYAIIDTMEQMNPQLTQIDNYKQKLWNQLALISDFKLDIDWPYNIEQARTITTKPQPMPYPMSKIPVRHYGKMMFELFDKLKTMAPGKERDELIKLTANQMKRNLYQWSHGSSDDEKVASDLAKFTDGKVQLDLQKFKFEKIDYRDTERKRNTKRK